MLPLVWDALSCLFCADCKWPTKVFQHATVEVGIVSPAQRASVSLEPYKWSATMPRVEATAPMSDPGCPPLGLCLRAFLPGEGTLPAWRPDSVMCYRPVHPSNLSSAGFMLSLELEGIVRPAALLGIGRMEAHVSRPCAKFPPTLLPLDTWDQAQ